LNDQHGGRFALPAMLRSSLDADDNLPEDTKRFVSSTGMSGEKRPPAPLVRRDTEVGLAPRVVLARPERDRTRITAAPSNPRGSHYPCEMRGDHARAKIRSHFV
jgi:hypothetical protein